MSSHVATTQSQRPAPPFCPSCGADVNPRLANCWLCHAPLDKAEKTAASPFAPRAKSAAGFDGQFSIATLLLVTTLVAVCLGVFRFSPGLGVLLVLVAAPALVRTIYAGRREKRHGQRLSIAEKISQFLLSLAVMGAVWMAAAMAFFMTCAGTIVVVAVAGQGSPDAAMGIGIAGLVASLVISIGVAVLILRATWPKGN